MRRLPILGAAAILALSACTGSPTTDATTTPSTSSTTLGHSTQTTHAPVTSTTQLQGALAEYLGKGLGVGSGLVPNSQTDGDRSVIDVTFTDGRRVEFVYPSSWRLDERAWMPDTTIVYDFDEPRQDGSGVIHAQLLFRHESNGEWTMSLNPMSVWSAEELATAESHVALKTEPNGFVTVETTRPLSHHTPDPDQAPIASDFAGKAGIYVDDILGLSSTGTCVDDPVYPYPQRAEFSVTWCDEDAGVTIAFLVPEEYHDEILNSVDVRLISTGPSE